MKQKSASLLLFKKDDESLMGLLHNYKFQEFILPRNQKEYVYVIDKKKVYFIFLKIPFKIKNTQIIRFSGVI